MDITNLLLTIAIAVVVGGLMATGRPWWWPWFQRAQLSTLNTQLSRLEMMLSNPAHRLANTTRHAANRTVGVVLVMFGMTMVALLGILAGVEGGVHDGDVTVSPQMAWLILVFAVMMLGGVMLSSNADTKLREHAGAEQLAEKVKKQIETLRPSVPR